MSIEIFIVAACAVLISNFTAMYLDVSKGVKKNGLYWTFGVIAGLIAGILGTLSLILK